MEAPPSPDYIPGPEAPLSPDYIPGPEPPPLPDYIPGPEYPEYLPPADDMLLAEEQPLPAAVSPTAESPGYITDSELEIEQEENDGDDKKSEGDSIDYSTSGGDNDANDDGDDLSEDDADDEDDEEISVLSHIIMPFRSESEVERLLAIPTPPLSPISLTSYTLPPLLMPLPIFTPLLTSSFLLPLSLPSTSGESYVAAAAARQIRPTLTIAESRRADDRLIGRLRRERRYFHTLFTNYAQEVAHSHDYCTQVMDYCQSREHIDDEDRLTMHIQHEHAQRDVAPEDESVFSISNCIAETQVKFASCTLIGSALTWWNSHMRAVSQEVAYAMPWRTLKQMMTANYNLRFQELTLLCGKMFPKESGEIERYVGGLPKMIWGNVMSYEPKSIQKAIESANDQMDQKLLGITDRQADNKRRFDNTLRNQQNQQPFRRNNNVTQAYAARSGEKPYRGTKPLCPKCNFYHDRPCRPKCTNCKRTGHIARDCRSQAANPNYNNNNNRRATVAYQGGNQNQAGNGNAVARAYGLGTAGGNLNANVVTVP
nr:hypothetical protein [Tanacetum cinerariifolium]